MSQTYGATPGGTPATAGGAADAAPLLGKGLKGKKIGGAERLWMDMFIAVVSLVVIVGTFFVTIELMNNEYKRTTFEVYTGCLATVTERRQRPDSVRLRGSFRRRAGQDGESEGWQARGVHRADLDANQ